MKRRADSTPFEQHAVDLDRWLGAENVTYDAAVQRLALQKGFQCSRSALHKWWTRRQRQRVQDEVLARLASGSQTAAAVEKAFEKNAPPAVDTLIKLVRGLVMQLAVHGEAGDAKAMVDLLRPVMEHLRIEEKRKDRELELRKVTLLEEKASEAKAKLEGVVKGGGLSAETLKAIEEAVRIL